MLRSGIRLRCPRCGVGRLYAKPFKMFDDCPTCNLRFEREQGYFIGAMYINYAATVAIAQFDNKTFRRDLEFRLTRAVG